MNKKGMTLIELIIALALTVILIAAMAGVFYPVIKIFDSQKVQSNIKDIANQVITIFKEEIRDAQKITLSNSDESGMVCYYVVDGKVETNDPTNSMINAMPAIYLEDEYSVNLIFSAIDVTKRSINIELTVVNRETAAELKTYSGSASPLNPEAVFTDVAPADPALPDVREASHLCIKK